MPVNLNCQDRDENGDGNVRDCTDDKHATSKARSVQFLQEKSRCQRRQCPRPNSSASRNQSRDRYGRDGRNSPISIQRCHIQVLPRTNVQHTRK
jgi:hypothetical protein